MRRDTCLPFLGLSALIAATFATSPAVALGPRIPDPIPPLIERGDVTIGLHTVASGFGAPVTATFAPNDKDHLFVAEQNGKIWSVSIGDDDGHEGDHHGEGSGGENDGASTPRLFADLGAQGLNLGCFFINYDERGFFGLAFHPDYRKNGLVYTYQSQPHEGTPKLGANKCNSTFPDHDNVVTEWRVNDPRSDDAVIDPTSGREVLRVAHPQFNHNGGDLRFGPDGFLYVPIGDGGAANDRGAGHIEPGGNAQNLATLLGKILRIDPMAGSKTPGHEIPASNPFVDTPGARGEIWAFGLRNPYKMSFDSETSQLYVADVGQNDIEEIDIVTRGMNYGWPIKEGTFAFSRQNLPGFVTGDQVTGPFVDPIAEYDHCIGPVAPDLVGPCPQAEGIAIVGGFVYRGTEIKELRGHYVFGDYSTNFFKSAGRLFYLDDQNQIKEFRLTGMSELGFSVLGIGQDARGELYVLGKTGAVPGNVGITDPNNTSGAVRKLTPADKGDD
jgi:glucose/arabinose dehydrogenase